MKESDKRKDLFEYVLKKSNKMDIEHLNYCADNNENVNNITRIDITVDLLETTQILQWQLERITGQEVPLKTIKPLLQFAFKQANNINLIDKDEK